VPDGWWGGDPVGEWTFWPAGGGDPAPLKAEAPIVLTVGWERRLGIRTGYRSSEPQALFAALPYPKDGIALAGGGRLEPVASVSRLVPRWRELIPSLEADVDAAEEKTVRELINRKIWVHPVPQPERAARSAELEAWYTAMLNQPGWSTSYIEAVKKYPPGPDDEGCGLETFISGWVHHNTRTSKPKTELTAKISYCDRAGVSYMLPFGLLRLRNRTHWVVQISSHEQEWYGVVEATPDRVRFAAEYFGGGRPGAR
jgi:hypothetical protein